MFGQEPFVFGVKSPFQGMDGLIMIAGDEEAAMKQVADRPALAAQVDAWNANPQFAMPGNTRIATDDWPYIYLEKPGVPLLYWLLGVVLVILFLRGAKQLPKGTFRLARNRDSWHFFLLGAAFMLLETQNVSKAAVALGSTWWVNAVIISAVLAMILLSNLIASLWPKLPMAVVFAGLIGSCVGLYFVDISAFISLPFALRALVVGAVTSLPILFSGIVFIRAFAAAPDKGNALGCNLMGSLCGGLLQSVTFLTGIQALLLIVATLYLGAFLTLPGRKRSAVVLKEEVREPVLANAKA